jgi:hypothetical protein
MKRPDYLPNIVLSDEQKKFVEAYAKKFGGLNGILKTLHQATSEMNVSIFRYFNHLENSGVDERQPLNCPKISHAGIEQQLGGNIAFSIMVMYLLQNNYPESMGGTQNTIDRWFAHAHSHATDPAKADE